jgi:hypothetical protein
LKEVNIRLAYLKAIALFLPVTVVVECDATLLFSILGWDLDAGNFAKAFENLAQRAFVFGRQSMS